MRDRLRKLNKLEEMLAGVKDAKDPAMAAAEELALSLEVGDTPPERQPRGPTKQKQKTETKSRLPYHTYMSADGIGTDCVAAASDQLTLKERDPNDWWLHVSGCPGSHVVIRDTSEKPPVETVQDAAVLAAHFSQVRLVGNVITVKVDLKMEKQRIERLLETKS
ncbi:hypothetical protein GUITHDRAFT_139194 [Guillardia theta CCMP2712]|uniref:NFACT RNA-binding domain-containing protein n=1 Tax=Guillardia theta (strain CCMP2712) TaxID=905079 RepID=L1JAH1_GUITC|nr:hypothetical protein GUITHDRAFT_139194 [Guillardia theta CCMP2712]EKX45287.1 hypothetical protein GUITHDRAFT_139194 [Guillardia theta CCMP2712]|eukprot:XP_005832267.1 hypothetical protein GUITHDRAFT_139194 [Guillardia theta CCMP2712]